MIEHEGSIVPQNPQERVLQQAPTAMLYTRARYPEGTMGHTLFPEIFEGRIRTANILQKPITDAPHVRKNFLPMFSQRKPE